MALCAYVTDSIKDAASVVRENSYQRWITLELYICIQYIHKRYLFCFVLFVFVAKL